MQFKELNILPTILKALEKENYAVPTPIQEQAIPVILNGRDLLGCAQTGTGKTAAFAIPTLQLLDNDKLSTTTPRMIRALIITPTRELALQIQESFHTYGKFTKLKSCVIFGGVSQKPQEELLKQGVDILVATPGRLNDLINQKLVNLSHIKIFILDEADRMLDMGFINDVNRIIARIPVKKQTLLFSATMPPSIAKLADTLLNNPAKIEITPVSSTVDMIDQYLYFVDKNNKKDLLLHILKDNAIVSALVFTRTKHGADRIVRQLAKEHVSAQAIHGDKSQGARQQALNNFKNKTLRVLIATDIAARGIDIDELSHVINYDLPDVPETYVHRIGRTGRAGLGGVAISFCDFDEKVLLADIERLIGKRITVVNEHPFPLINDFPAVKVTQPRRKEGNRNIQQTASSQRQNSKDDRIMRGIENRITASDAKKAMHTTVSNPKGTDRTVAKRNVTNKFSTDKTVTEKSAVDKTTANRTGFRKNTGTRIDINKPKGASSKSSSKATPITSDDNKKYRMTSDGVLKEKRSSFNPFNRKKKFK